MTLFTMVMLFYICFHFHAMRCASVAVTEVADMFLILHCESYKHAMMA